MDPEKQRQIASKGGKSLSIEVRREIGRKGGMARAEKLRRNFMVQQNTIGEAKLQETAFERDILVSKPISSNQKQSLETSVETQQIQG